MQTLKLRNCNKLQGNALLNYTIAKPVQLWIEFCSCFVPHFCKTHSIIEMQITKKSDYKTHECNWLQSFAEQWFTLFLNYKIRKLTSAKQHNVIKWSKRFKDKWVRLFQDVSLDILRFYCTCILFEVNV